MNKNVKARLAEAVLFAAITSACWLLTHVAFVRWNDPTGTGPGHWWTFRYFWWIEPTALAWVLAAASTIAMIGCVIGTIVCLVMAITESKESQTT